MLVNNIVNQNFTPTGKGGIKASEVTAHLEKVANEFSRLQKENATIKERVAAITPIIDEYNSNKSAIATILINSQKEADKTIEAAKAESAQLFEEAKLKADRYSQEKKAEAEALYDATIKEKKAELDRLKADVEKLKADFVVLSEKYIIEINKKAKAVIDDANEKAKNQIAQAHAEIESAEKKAAEAIAENKAELKKLKSDIASFKSQAQSICKAITDKLNDVEISEEENLEFDVPSDFEAEELDFSQIPEFSIDYSVIENEDSGVSTHIENEFKPYFPSMELPEIPDVNLYTSDIFKAIDSKEAEFSSFGSASINDDIIKGTAISLEDVKIEENE